MVSYRTYVNLVKIRRKSGEGKREISLTNNKYLNIEIVLKNTYKEENKLFQFPPPK